MKNILILILLSFLLLSCGRKDDETKNPLDQLPPATQTGANTIGCLVNGEVFLPRQNNPLGPSPKNCYYQYVDGGWEFGLSIINDKNGVRGVHISTNKLELTEGLSYSISNESAVSSVFAYYTLPNNQFGYATNNNFIGQLKITKLDKIKHIISGTFYFDAIRSNTGEVIKITDGRFDMQYTP